MRQAPRLFRTLTLRGWRYLFGRPLVLVQTYGIGARAMKQRVLECVRLLARYGCRPTLPTTSVVVDHHPAFCRELQSMGVELAVHGHVHVDYRRLSEKRAADNMATATRLFDRHHIPFSGYRCPYLGCQESPLRGRLQNGFHYGSNQTIWWDVIPPEAVGRASSLFRSLNDFYRPEPAEARVAVPQRSGDLVEIPISLSDDAQITNWKRRIKQPS